jgi:8-oxo-dGTP pyrophosphatase MutT (NUDIX family)
MNLKEWLRQILSRRERKSVEDQGLTPAAVLVPLYFKSGQWYLLFTKRTQRVNEHKGEISFPGGVRHEETEPLEQTALRESFEEIGLKAEDVEILGELDQVMTLTTNYAISPFVACIPYPYEFKLNPEEVEEIVEVPLSALRDRVNFREEYRFRQGKVFPVYFYHYREQIIWGATARILKQFLELVEEAPLEI